MVLVPVLVLVVVCSGQQPWADRIWGREVERELGSAAKATSGEGTSAPAGRKERTAPGTGLAARHWHWRRCSAKKGVYIPSWAGTLVHNATPIAPLFGRPNGLVSVWWRQIK